MQTLEYFNTFVALAGFFALSAVLMAIFAFAMWYALFLVVNFKKYREILVRDSLTKKFKDMDEFYFHCWHQEQYAIWAKLQKDKK